jgi:hypothetical protein
LGYLSFYFTTLSASHSADSQLRDEWEGNVVITLLQVMWQQVPEESEGKNRETSLITACVQAMF